MEERRIPVDTLGLDRVRWGPIAAGVAVAIASLVVLTVLGVAIGLSAFDPENLDASQVRNGAAIWGIGSALIAFVLGGYVAAYSAGVSGAGNGTLNGLMVGVATIVLMTWFVGAGLGNLLGVVGENLGDVMSAGRELADADRSAAFGAAEVNSWISLAGLGLALGSSALGGLIGHRQREAVFAPQRSRVYEERRPAA